MVLVELISARHLSAPVAPSHSCTNNDDVHDDHDHDIDDEHDHDDHDNIDMLYVTFELSCRIPHHHEHHNDNIDCHFDDDYDNVDDDRDNEINNYEN